MTELQLVEAAIKYGPIAIVIWFMYRDWRREERLATAIESSQKRQTEQAENYASSMREITVSAVEAIAETRDTLKEIRNDISSTCKWDGNERRHT